MLEWEVLGIGLFLIFALLGSIFKVIPALPKKPSAQERNGGWDSLRGLSMIGIVCIHIHSYYTFFIPEGSNLTFCTLFLANLSRFSVPVFILSSGLFLRKKDDYWVSKVKTIVLPYLLFSVIAYFIKTKDISFLDFIFRVFLGKTFTPYYFIPLLLQFHFLFYILPKQVYESALAPFFLPFSFLLQLSSNLGYIDAFLPYEYRSISILNFLFFFHLGIVGQVACAKNTKEGNIPTYLSLAILFVCLIPIAINKIELKNHHPIYPILVSGFLLSVLSTLQQSGWLSRSLGYIGKNSMYVFLIHPFVIHTMHSFYPVFAFGFVLSYLLTLALNIAIPLIPVYLWQLWKKD